MLNPQVDCYCLCKCINCDRAEREVTNARLSLGPCPWHLKADSHAHPTFSCCIMLCPVTDNCREAIRLGSGPRYMICVTVFCKLQSQTTHGHVRIARETRAILSRQCVVWLCNVQKGATKSDTSGHCLIHTAEEMRYKEYQTYSWMNRAETRNPSLLLKYLNCRIGKWSWAW